MNKINCIDFYLDYLNNFLTVDCIAEHYSISNDAAYDLINKGRFQHSIASGDSMHDFSKALWRDSNREHSEQSKKGNW